MATPGETNILIRVNTPPSILPIGTRITIQGQPSSFTVQATDAQAGQTLSYNIVSGAPLGAILDPSTGLFSWTPPFLFAPTTNAVTIKVADNGTPPLNATDSFTLISLPPPPAIVQNGTAISLSFQTIPGKTYRVEYKNSLSDPAWLVLGGVRPAGAAPRLTVADELTSRPQRFYRIVQLD